jgi:hypothetical protein
MQTRLRSILPRRPSFAGLAAFLVLSLLPRPGTPQVREYIYMGDKLLAIEGPQITLQFTAAQTTVTEAQDVTLTVTVTVPGGGPHGGVSFNYTLVNGTAMAGPDFVGTHNQPIPVNIPPGQPSAVIPIDIVNDTTWEENETFSVVLSSPSGAVLGSPSTHTVTILDDEPTIEFVGAASSVTEAPGVSQVVDVRLLLRPGVAATSSTVTFNFATRDGSARAGLGDYTASSGTRSFVSGTQHGAILQGADRIAIPIGDDALDEPAQDFFVDLTAITDNDNPPALSIGNATIAEGDQGVALASLAVTLSAPSEFTVSVSYATADGTALGGGRDYWGRGPAVVEFAPLDTSQTVRVPVVGDIVAEPTETFFVDLSLPQNATLLDPRGDVSITEADVAGLAVNHVTVAEGRIAVLTVTLPSPPAQPVSVSYETLPGSATPGDDYVHVSGTVTITPPASSATFNVTTLADSAWENQEGIGIRLFASSGPPIAYPLAKVAIIDLHLGSDFNGDRGTDLLWRHEGSGQISVWYMNRVQLSSGASTNPGTHPLNWKVVGTGAFRPVPGWELLWWDQTTGNLQVWEMSQANRVNLSGTTPAGVADNNWHPVATGDFNADGKSDIVWRHAVSGQIAMWMMDGYTLLSGTLTTPDSLPLEWQLQGAADMDSSGSTDLVWRHVTSGQLVVWFMYGSTLAAGEFLDPEALVGNTWQLRVIRDFDGDGKPDLLWRNTASGENAVWWMEGHILKYGEFGTPLPPGGWTLAGPR